MAVGPDRVRGFPAPPWSWFSTSQPVDRLAKCLRIAKRRLRQTFDGLPAT